MLTGLCRDCSNSHATVGLICRARPCWAAPIRLRGYRATQHAVQAFAAHENCSVTLPDDDRFGSRCAGMRDEPATPANSRKDTRMRLANFIRAHLQQIIREWVEFASTLRPFTRATDS